MKYNHQFTRQALPLHRNKGRNGLQFGYFQGSKNALYCFISEIISIINWDIAAFCSLAPLQFMTITILQPVNHTTTVSCIRDLKDR
jgi:hypothetical protein